MHTVKVKNNRCYANWCRANAREGFQLTFGDEEDTYIFFNECDAEMLKEHVARLDERSIQNNTEK
jgi:site-specific DNA-adenine methylase